MESQKKRLQPGEFITIRLPYSEVCIHLGVANTVMRVELTKGQYPMAQLWRNGYRYSTPIICGEVGIYHDVEGFYAYPAEGE